MQYECLISPNVYFSEVAYFFIYLFKMKAEENPQNSVPIKYTSKYAS